MIPAWNQKQNTKQFMGDVGPSLESCKDFVKWSPHVPLHPFQNLHQCIEHQVPSTGNSLPDNHFLGCKNLQLKGPTVGEGTIKLNGRLNLATQVRVETQKISIKQDTRSMAPKTFPKKPIIQFELPIFLPAFFVGHQNLTSHPSQRGSRLR